ncbi:MAG TPA: biotin/lipoyl-containing protein [Steroidobacteraceae bacterium]|nr:biotin/lipoyl-containing protein [Steroidobacteraceae bacterium]
MTLTAKDVAEISRLLEDSSFDELILELDGLKLTLRRSGASAMSGSSPSSTTSDPEIAATARSDAAPVLAPASAATQNVTAPLLGTFYRAPKPGAPPFVEAGSAVEDDTIIGIIEVMKLMNTVRAGLRGTVIDILAKDGSLVEYGETLIRVRKATQA